MNWKSTLPKENIFFETENGILYKGDSQKILKSFKNGLVDAVITDPPYMYLDHKLDRLFNEDIIFSSLNNILKEDNIITLFGRGTSFYEWNVKLSKMGFKFLEELIWDKKMNSTMFLKINRIHETISIHSKGNKRLNEVRIDKTEYYKDFDTHKLIDDLKKLVSRLRKINNFNELQEFLKGGYTKSHSKYYLTISKNTKDRDRAYKVLETLERGLKISSIIRIVREHYTMKHPTQKPLKLLEILVELTSNKNELILDPFLGGGTTAVACEKLNRRWIGIEIDDEYCEISKNRIKEATRQKSLF